MATNQLGAPPNINFTDKRKTARGGNSNELVSAALLAATASNDDMDAALLAAGYTQSRIDKMTGNDKVYALRLINDPTSV